MSTYSKLDKLYKASKTISFSSQSKFIIMSDCHRGTGTFTDQFLPNRPLFLAALQYYYDEGFTYIELGDGDELWQNSSYLDIIETYSDCYSQMARFYQEDRFYMLYGNHDKIKMTYNLARKRDFIRKPYTTIPLLPNITVYESLLLRDEMHGYQVFLVHGHQGDLMNDQLWLFTKGLVRYIWKPLELIGFHDPTSATGPKQKHKVEQKLSNWVQNKPVIVIAGHTHRYQFARPGSPLYFNDGSCVGPGYISGIEMKDGKLQLVRWSITPRSDRTLFIGRQIIDGPVLLSKYFE